MHNVVNSEIRKAGESLLVLREGVIDTSTLIYLDCLDLLPLASSFFLFHLSAAVATEFGCCPEKCRIHAVAGSGNADLEVIQLAFTLGVPVFSDDRKVLMAGRRAGLEYYNTLMLLLGLLLQGSIDIEQYRQARDALEKTARYSKDVWAFGDAVFSLYVR
jgi:hypothetical protein